MTFLSNLFRTAPGRDEWPFIAASISSGFQDVKKRWFNECVVAVDLGLFADKQTTAAPASSADKQASVRVVHTDLGGAGALAITGYQIFCASRVITANGYTLKTSTRDFVDLLRGRVSGVASNEILGYLRRYDAENNDASAQRFKFGVDVASYIIDEDPSNVLSLHVASLAEKLFTLSAVVVANAFGDSVRAHKLSRQITMLDARVWADF
jgi:hypothetical protein